MNIKLEDPELILSCAFRYALGRRTYIVSTVVSEILNNWEQINTQTLERFKKEILEHKGLYKSLGMACDEQDWMSIVNKPILHEKVNRNDLLNGWLRYHNTNVDKVIQTYSKEILDSPEWFKLYPCTQNQCDEWELWVKRLLKFNKWSKSMIERKWSYIYLDCSPYVKKSIDD